MKPIIALSVALAYASTAASSAGAETSSTLSRARHHARHAPQLVSSAVAPTPTRQAPNEAAAQPFAWITSLFPSVKPYPPGQGDTDGLSRNTDDCNKGCIDNPIQ
jgi:hypothetical protein